MVKNAKVKCNNGGPGKHTKHGHCIKMVSPEKDNSKKVSSLPVNIYTMMYVYIVYSYTYIALHILCMYVYVFMYV
jgi:hypothetical protein